MLGPERAKAFVWAELCRDALRRLAQQLAPHGVRLLVMKGVHLAFAIADEPYRHFDDVDAVVVEGGYARALARLRAEGQRIVINDWSACSVFDARGRNVDLHRRPLPAFVGRLDATALRRRAIDRSDVFGPSVMVPDPLDAAVIAIGHFVKDKVGAFRDEHLSVDLRLLEERAGVTPRALAERLREHGLRRAALVAFTVLARSDAHFGELLTACEPSSLERRWAIALAGFLSRQARRHRAAGFVAARTIGDSPFEIAANLVAGTATRLPYIVMERLR